MEEKMKSKIEEIGKILFISKVNKEIPEVVDLLSSKIDELIEAHNSQPEEWEDRIRDLILDISADRLVSSEKVVAIVQSLLDDREREVYVDGYKDGITRCMESLDKLLNSKKK